MELCNTPQLTLIEVRSSWSVVERTKDQARAETRDRLLVYLFGQGRRWFRNAHGQEFNTVAGSVLIGGDDASFSALPAPGQRWSFTALSIPSPALALYGSRIRQGGLQLLPPQNALQGLLSQYLAGWCSQFDGIDQAGMAGALRALDELLSAAIDPRQGLGPSALHVVAQLRRCAAQDFIARHSSRNDLRPELIADHLHLSVRQMQRVFESVGSSLSGEIRRARLHQARQLLRATRQ